LSEIREHFSSLPSPITQMGGSDVDSEPPAPSPATAPAGEPPQVRAWVQAAQQGDRRAMEDLLEYFQDRVWRRARYRIGDHDEAWEVAQDVFLTCFRKIGQFRGESSFWGWLSRIVDNQVKNRQAWWRRRRRDKTFSMHDMWKGEDGEETQWDPADQGPSPRQQAQGRVAVEALEENMAQLSEEHREVLLLRFADGLSYEEIAEALDISLGTVKSRINRARQELREKMRKFL
jgi:RNA polymerase sigma-70 factor (ECF subfamily)